MRADPDYRGDKVDTAEGLGRARARWDRFCGSLPNDVERAAWGSGSMTLDDAEQRWPGIRQKLAAQAKERSELIGFWVTWHLAGGFENLVAAGWHRATVFRKIRRFRGEFGAHPDEYTFPWLKLDANKAWMLDFDEALGVEPQPE